MIPGFDCIVPRMGMFSGVGGLMRVCTLGYTFVAQCLVFYLFYVDCLCSCTRYCVVFLSTSKASHFAVADLYLGLLVARIHPLVKPAGYDSSTHGKTDKKAFVQHR